MSRIFFLMSIMLVLFGYGCASTVIVEPVTHPPYPSFKEVAFTAPVIKELKFKEEKGKKSLTEDNVTVEIASITEEYNDKNFSISFRGPNKEQLEYSVFPMVVALKITNNTDHIVTLERTIVRLEDDELKEYPMVSSMGENKTQLIRKIQNAFRKYKEELEKANYETYKEVLNGEYKSQYEAMLNRIKEARAKGSDIATPELNRDGKKLTEWGIENVLIKGYSPEGVYEKNRYDFFSTVVLPSIQSANVLEAETMQKINNDIPNNVKGVITSGVYQPINILPGRAEKVLVPFAKRSEDEKIRSISIGVYDLPTRLDQAGVPIKRANFNFKMIATE